MSSSSRVMLLGCVALAACAGVKVGGRTVVEPIARPGVRVAGAGHAVDVGGVAPGPGDGATEGATEVGAAEVAAAGSMADGSASVGDGSAAWRGPGAPDRPTASPAVMAARASTGCFVADRTPNNRTAPSDGPVDPWRAVDRGRPRVLPHVSTPWLDRGDVACDAAHDHCLRDCTWLVTTDTGAQSWLPEVHERDATDDGWDSVNSDVPFLAFRSVPATRDNLDVGLTALASAESPRPGSAWTYGTVEAIDWAEGTVRLHGHRAAYPLAFTRVAVLRYSGSTVEPVR